MTGFDTISISLRPATEDDLPLMLEIERASYPLPWTEGAFREELLKPFSNVLVLTDDETDSIVVGYIVFWTMFDECHILNVAVNSDWRGLGHAKNLVGHAINVAIRKNMKRLFLEVRKSNEGAIALYKSLGFYVDHIKETFYDDGEDALFMVRYLEKNS